LLVVYSSTVPVQGQFYIHIGTRLVGSQGISVATVIGFIAAVDTGSSSFILVALPYFAVFCRILPAIIFCQILPAIFCHILPNSASHILPSSAVDTSRFKRVEDGERVGIYRHILAGLNSSSRVIIVIMQATRRKKRAPIYRLC
jgi:hypothetical protein